MPSKELFSQSLAKVQKIVDGLLENPEDDLRFLRAVYPGLKSRMDNLHDSMRDEVFSIDHWLCRYQGKEASCSKRLEDYFNIVPVIETLIDEAFSPRDLISGNSPSPSASISISSANGKKNFSISNFDPNLPKGPKDINIIEKNPLDDVLKKITFENSIFKIDLEKTVVFVPNDLPEPIWIDKEESLKDLAITLAKCTEIAVDLENHSFYSYNGYSCLMQISTRNRDYLIDTVVLRGCLKKHLQQVFENPSIIKIFHGAESDIYWLQRDFGIFVASIFDSYYGSRKLGLERQSLGYLIGHYFGYEMDKSFQTADWRIRPLTPEMILYAQLDTHCLFPLYDAMRIALITRCGREGLEDVLRRSSQQGLKLYRPDVFDIKAAVKQLGQLDKDLFGLASRVMAWRDFVAKDMDICPYAVAAPKDLKESILLGYPHRHIKKIPSQYVLQLEDILKNGNEESDSPKVGTISMKREHIFFEEEPCSKKTRTIKVKAISRVVGSSCNTSMNYTVKYAEAATVISSEVTKDPTILEELDTLEDASDTTPNPVREFQPIRKRDGKAFNLDELAALPKEESAQHSFEHELPSPQFPFSNSPSVVEISAEKKKMIPKPKEITSKAKANNNNHRSSKIFRRTKGKVSTFM